MTTLWGGRFSAEPNMQMRALNDSIGFDIQLYPFDIQGSMAYAAALARAGLLTGDEAAAIQNGLATVLEEFKAGSFAVKDGDEDIHTAVERRLKELIGDAAGKLHTGRSRNDQVATDLRLWLKDACLQVSSLLRGLQMALVEAAEPHLYTIIPGYTHLQPAQPVTVAHWLMSFFWMLERDHARFADCARRADFSPLGSSALAGTPYPIDREKLASDLGFAGVTPNSMDAVADRDGAAEFLFAASLLMVHLSKLAEDVIIYAAMGFLKLPDAYSTGSSIMPQKRNPDPLELARGKTGRVIGHLTGFLTLLKGLPSVYNKDLQEDKEPLFDTLHTLHLLLPVVAGMLPALEWAPEKLRAALDEGLLATELADYLVLKGLPFRQAHHVVGQLVKASEQAGKPFTQLPLAVFQDASPLFQADIYEQLSFAAAVEKRIATGGTSSQAVQQQIDAAKEILQR